MMAEPTAAQRWRSQQHERRVRALGRAWLADEWEAIAAQLAADGLLDQEKVLDLMLDAYRQGVWLATLPRNHPLAMWRAANGDDDG